MLLVRFVRVCSGDFPTPFDTFSGILPRKYNVLGLSAMASNTSVNPHSRGEIWLIFVKIDEKSVDIFFLL